MTFKECIAVALIGLWILLAPPKAMADDVDEVVRQLTVELEHLTKHPVPHDIGVVWVNDLQMFEQCRCYAKGLFVEGGVRLSQDVDLNTNEGKAVLLHELVHGMQWALRGVAMNCADWIAREEEALRIERLWRSQHGTRLAPPPAYRCKEPT